MVIGFLTSADCVSCGRVDSEDRVFCQPCVVNAKEYEQLWG